MADCEHSQHWNDEECPGLTEAEVLLGEHIRSIALNFVASCGRDQWHGETIKERTDEMFANAARYGNRPPEYSGRAVLR